MMKRLCAMTLAAGLAAATPASARLALWRGELSAQAPTPAAAPAANQERDFLTRVRRLTVEGKRAGEGYWAPDGKRLVFQSERDATNPFYQIYVLDFATGETRRISPGIGKTTCAFFRPGSDQILFASTHHDPKSKQYQDEELAFRASGKERRYAWDYDTEMEIYAFSEKSGALTRLTNAKGLRRRGRLLAGRPVDCVLVDARRLQPHAVARGTEAARHGPQLLRRDLHHEGRRHRPAPPHQHARLRRRPLLHEGRQHRLATLRRARV